MNSYLKSITPDSFSGAIFALEGIKNSVVLLNGPSGCKFYHSSISDSQRITQASFDPFHNPDSFFFGQPRVPCTYLDSNDYVYGSIEKLELALDFLLQEIPFEIVAIINSPGAALIGDDIKGILDRMVPEVPSLAIESPGYSLDMYEGFDNAILDLLRLPDLMQTKSNSEQDEGQTTPSVNILGLSIYHKYYKGDIEELRRMLDLCGIAVNCFIGADCTLDELSHIPKAALNIVIHPEHCIKSASYLEEDLGMPTLWCPGPPIGFKASEALMVGVCEALDISCDPYHLAAERARAKAFAYISRVNSMTGMPKGVPFAIEGYPADVHAFIKFLYDYFSLVLDAVSLKGTRDTPGFDELKSYLLESDRAYALETDILATSAELVFANASTLAALRQGDTCFSGIEIELPSFGYLDVIPKTHLGLSGALLLTEQVLNGILF